ncbi:MAG: MBL fold metallo-hydrolase, partial [Bacillota bacterium]|nr:MBL fold metallo-hydrolase [Bacillota bacterium]
YPDDGVVEGLAGGNENNYSLVKVLYYGDRSVMFTGDIEGPVEDYLVSQGIEEVDVLKVAHHGSNSSSSQAFLDLLSPEIGVIQVGNNSYGHPSIEVLERLDQLGTKIYRNDLNGAIILSLRGDKWQVDTMIK